MFSVKRERKVGISCVLNEEREAHEIDMRADEMSNTSTTHTINI